jgi:hypothetical protein
VVSVVVPNLSGAALVKDARRDERRRVEPIMSNLEMSFVERLVILIDDSQTELCGEIEARLSISSTITESGLRRDVPTPSALN